MLVTMGEKVRGVGGYGKKTEGSMKMFCCMNILYLFSYYETIVIAAKECRETVKCL